MCDDETRQQRVAEDVCVAGWPPVPVTMAANTWSRCPAGSQVSSPKVPKVLACTVYLSTSVRLTLLPTFQTFFSFFPEGNVRSNFLGLFCSLNTASINTALLECFLFLPSSFISGLYFYSEILVSNTGLMFALFSVSNGCCNLRDVIVTAIIILNVKLTKRTEV